MTESPEPELVVPASFEGVEDPTFSATAFCPVCCSTIDVIGSGVKRLDCAHCGQLTFLVIDADRFAKYSAV